MLQPSVVLARQRHLERLRADQRGDARAHLLAQLHHADEVRPAAAPVAEVPLELPAHRLVGRPWSGPKVPH